MNLVTGCETEDISIEFGLSRFRFKPLLFIKTLKALTEKMSNVCRWSSSV